MKKLITLIFVVILIISCFAFGVYAADDMGMTIDVAAVYPMAKCLEVAPQTLEAWIYIPQGTSCEGIIVGNYGSVSSCLNFEINSDGSPRLYVVSDEDSITYDVNFGGVDVRTGKKAHVAIVNDEAAGKVYCYLNGELAKMVEQTVKITTAECGDVHRLGCDYRKGNAEYFKGMIGGVTLYSDVRTAEEIKADMMAADLNDDALIASYDTYGAIGDVISDNSGNGYDIRYVKKWVDDKEPITDYAYAFGVIGDIQTLTYGHTEELACLYDWIVENKEEKKIEFVFGMGDITQNDIDSEWEIAREQMDKLDGVVPYALIRGNHDGIENYNKYISNTEFSKTLEGVFTEGEVTNAWKTFSVGDTDFLVLMLDYMPTNAALEWAAEVIEAHPNHKVIVTTHSYLSKTGKTVNAVLGTRNDGSKMWNKLISQHENIFLVLSGHIPSEFVVSTQTKGIYGNTVTQLLVDPQRVDVYEGATGMIALLYISKDGKTLHVEQYSTVRDMYFMSSSQYSLELPEPICYKHEYSEELSYDSESHYYLCDCGEMKDKEEHIGGTPTCTERAVCSDCGASYGDLGHTGGEATCLARAKCEKCGVEYGSYANHKDCVFDSFSGRFVCSVCKENCEHSSFTDGACDSCGFVCVHDWVQRDNVSVCTVCEKTCSVHDTVGLDFKCAYCGYDNGLSNSFSAGNKTITDGALLLDKQHKFTLSFNVTVGSPDTVLNIKDTNRKDNVYYSETESSNNKSAFYSLLTWYNNSGYDTIVSLWCESETAETLWLVNAADKTKQICEIELGKEYSFDFEIYPASAEYVLVINGDKENPYSGSFNAIATELTKSLLRFGEVINAKRLHVQKIGFTDISVGYPSYENGTCEECGVECVHIFNAGGHCIFCGELGNVITFADGQNGGGNIHDADNSGKPDGNASPFKAENGMYTAQYKAYKQVWDYRDLGGMLLGKNYVFGGKFTFTSYEYISSAQGTATRLVYWADGDATAANTRFGLYLLADKGGLDLSYDVYGKPERFALELDREYDIRVAARSAESSAGVYAHTAEVYIDGEFMWSQEFELTSEDGISIRMGDHQARKTRVRFNVSDDFGIRSIGDGISFIGTQSREDANYNYDPTFDLRFVFGIDDIYLGDVGVKVDAAVSGGNLIDDASGEFTCSSSRRVYTNIMANGRICQPGAAGAGYGGYYMALAVTDIQLDTSATYTFVLTPYTKRNDGETIFSENAYAITVTFENYKMQMSYSEIQNSVQKKQTVAIGKLESVKTLGRAYFLDEKLAADHAVSGLAVNLDCEGSVSFNITSAQAIKLSVTVDGKTAKNVVVDAGTSELTVAKGLAKGIHSIELVNETGLIPNAKVDINSVSFNGAACDAPKDSDFYIEFIGDSITAGYALSESDVGHHNDATLSYAYLSAEALDADYTIFARSGMGIAYSEDASNIFENFYPYATASRGNAPYVPTRVPNIVVINLHTNDNYQWFSMGNNEEGDYYNTATFDACFDNMVKTVTAQYGNDIPMLFVFGCMANESYTVATDRSVELIDGKYTDEGYNVKRVTLSTDRSNLNNHPSAEGAKIQSAELVAFIKENYSIFD